MAEESTWYEVLRPIEADGFHQIGEVVDTKGWAHNRAGQLERDRRIRKVETGTRVEPTQCPCGKLWASEVGVHQCVPKEGSEVAPWNPTDYKVQEVMDFLGDDPDPDEVQRVLSLEVAGDTPRKSLVAALEALTSKDDEESADA